MSAIEFSFYGFSFRIRWVPKGSLGDMLSDSGLHLTWSDPMLQLARDVANAMNYLHSREFEDETAGEHGSRRTSTKGSIIHRDLKPGTLLSFLC